jgi:hypothetical protein
LRTIAGDFNQEQQMQEGSALTTIILKVAQQQGVIHRILNADWRAPDINFAEMARDWLLMSIPLCGSFALFGVGDSDFVPSANHDEASRQNQLN